MSKVAEDRDVHADDAKLKRVNREHRCLFDSTNIETSTQIKKYFLEFFPEISDASYRGSLG